MTNPDVIKIGKKLVSIPDMTKWLIEQLGQKPILKPDELLEKWKLDEAAMRRVISRISREDILFSNGSVLYTPAIMDWLENQLLGGVISLDEALEEWPIQRSHMLELVSRIELATGQVIIKNSAGDFFTAAYLERQIVDLVESSQEPPSIKEISENIHISTDALGQVLSSISSVVLTESSQILAIGEIKYKITTSLTRESNPPQYKGVDLERIAEPLDLNLDVIKRIVSEFPEITIVNARGHLVLLRPLLSEFRAIVDNEGRVDIKKFLMDRNFETDVEEMLLKGITKSHLVTSKGILISEDWISTKIVEMALNKGLVDLRSLSQELDISFEDIIRIAKETMPKDIKLVDDEKTGKPSAVFNTKWLSDLESLLLTEGSIKILGLAKSLAVPIKLLENVLTRATGGLVDRDFEVFRLRNPADRRLVTTAEPRKQIEDMKIKRGGEWVGSTFKYKVKIWNDSENVITNVIVTLLAYPDDALSIRSEAVKRIPIFKRGESRGLEFQFAPTHDCVKGNILASINYVDHKGKPHSKTAEPFEVKAVCDLLLPERLTTNEFLHHFTRMPKNEEVINIEGFDGADLVEYIRRALELSNFSIVSTSENLDNQGKVYSVIGWARGKYTKRGVGVEVRVHPGKGKRPSQVDVDVIGEDESMLAPVQEELGERINPWNCPYCLARLKIGTVASLRDGKPVECSNCGTVFTHTSNRE